jgi:hypothetical protein
MCWVKIFKDKKWSELTCQEIDSVSKNGEIIICKSSSQEGGMRYSIFRYEIFPKPYNEDLLGGGDICFKAHTHELSLAEHIAEFLKSQPLPNNHLESQIK